jgi:hypothetical protein
VVMQRNCHEFIAYENLVGSRRGPDRGGRQPGPVSGQAPIDQIVPLVRRALKVLSDREVSPQLGLLKSTLLQLDSTFSERTYGAGSFRDFAQKLASAGHVVLRESGRNVLVEAVDGTAAEEARPLPHAAPAPPKREKPREETHEAEAPQGGGGPGEPRTADGIREVRRLFQAAQNPPRWPMYIRQAKQFLRNVDQTFDERKFGFASLVDLLRACQRDGLFRIERDRQGVMRLFPGNVMQATVDVERDDDARGNVAQEPAVSEPAASEWMPAEAAAEGEVVDADVVQELSAPAAVVDGEAAAQVAEPEPAGRTHGRGRRKKQDEGKPGAEKKAPRARKAATARPRAPKKTPAGRKGQPHTAAEGA